MKPSFLKNKDTLFVLLISSLCIILYLIPTGFENPSLTQNLRYEKARILSVDNSEMKQISIVTTGVQEVRFVVQSGTFKGDTLTAENPLIGQKKIDKIFHPGDHVLAILQLNEAGTKILHARAAEFYRQNVEFILFLCFALFLILFAKYIGLKAIISFIFTALMFWKVLIPCFLNGYNPLVIATLVVFFCTVAIILLVGGVNKKGLVALLGTMAGVFITALLAITFGYFFKIPGAVQEYAEALLYTGFADLDLSTIFISVIFISAAGAVMDVSMDISAAQNELILRTPHLSRKELMKSGFRIASPVIGSMTTTLLFAYSGSFMFAFMAFMAKGTTIESIVNKNYIAAEILHTLVGSFGLVLVAPLTAIIGSYLYTLKQKKD
jgi:uncharacterized membrane protein